MATTHLSESEIKRLRAEAIAHHASIWKAESYPAERALRKEGWAWSLNDQTLESAERLVELCAFERHPEHKGHYRPRASGGFDIDDWHDWNRPNEPDPQPSTPSSVNADTTDERGSILERQLDIIAKECPAPDPGELEFIRQAVAVFEMLELRKFDDGDHWTLTVRHGAIFGRYTTTCRSVGIDRAPAPIVDGDALLEAFIGLAGGCVREGRKILNTYDAQWGRP
jgi:hypothetical protein